MHSRMPYIHFNVNFKYKLALNSLLDFQRFKKHKCHVICFKIIQFMSMNENVKNSDVHCL